MASAKRPMTLMLSSEALQAMALWMTRQEIPQLGRHTGQSSSFVRAHLEVLLGAGVAGVLAAVPPDIHALRLK